MKELDFIPTKIPYIERKSLIEIDGFVYSYSSDSEVYYKGRKYLCFESTPHHMWQMDMTDKEKRKSAEEFNVYMMPSSAEQEYVYIKDSALKNKVVELYKKKSSFRGGFSSVL